MNRLENALEDGPELRQDSDVIFAWEPDVVGDIALLGAGRLFLTSKL
jgi:hypothetical protein